MLQRRRSRLGIWRPWRWRRRGGGVYTATGCTTWSRRGRLASRGHGNSHLQQAHRGASADCSSSRPSSLSFLIYRPDSTDTLTYMAGATQVSCCGKRRDRAGGVVRLADRYSSSAREDLPRHSSSHTINPYPVPPPNPAAAGDLIGTLNIPVLASTTPGHGWVSCTSGLRS